MAALVLDARTDLQGHSPEDSWFKIACSEVYLMLRNYLVLGSNDQLAIMFYNTVSPHVLLPVFLYSWCSS